MGVEKTTSSLGAACGPTIAIIPRTGNNKIGTIPLTSGSEGAQTTPPPENEITEGTLTTPPAEQEKPDQQEKQDPLVFRVLNFFGCNVKPNVVGYKQNEAPDLITALDRGI